ncbi:unnamed protein product [Hyaloperonospora brassicae]|uniref:AN1-type domain-containing protein n=1 Tax=Hyaloperonospora brassicae TaxID=162125 RepID=A0AAV0TL24_HYABA|nr:unnamed protein product [Hyaloperonospora brassicae]
MAHRSPSVFDETPAPETPEMVAKTSTPSSAPAAADVSVSSASATATASPSSSVVVSTPALTSTEGLPSAASPATAKASSDVLSPSPVVLQSGQTALTFRKSCLKRSKLSASTRCSTARVAPTEGVEALAEPKRHESKSAAHVGQKNRRRCWACKAKVGLAAVTCRCSFTFCSKHRYAEEHACAFNFKTAAKRKLVEENPVVVPSKVARIS